MKRSLGLLLVVTASLSLFAVGCTDSQSEDETATGANMDEELPRMQDVTVAPDQMSLIVLGANANATNVINAVEKIGGKVTHFLPPRLIAAQVIPGCDPVLKALGQTQRYARAVDPSEIALATDAERRFVRVFSNRYYKASTPQSLLIEQNSIAPQRGETWEKSAQTDSIQKAAKAFAAATASGSQAGQEQAESLLYVPYASGTVVVSIILPESNGMGEPSTEDWTEEAIAGVYEKIQAALEAIKRHDDNSDLRFVLHYESKPANGGLSGTVDYDYEFGKRVNEGAEYDALMALLSKILGHEAYSGDMFLEYLNLLRNRYQADGAFMVVVGPDINYTAPFRAHASINGPFTAIPSSATWETFLHEFGHIFGAYDEYCPDACSPPTMFHGYLASINANAVYYQGTGGPGINNGGGEAQPSLMDWNRPNAVNGYTRTAWGWLDADGDGIVDVRDTEPSSALSASLVNGVVRLKGIVSDIPASSLSLVPFSANRIKELQYRFVGTTTSPWFSLTLPASERGRQTVDVSLGAMPNSSRTIEVRAINSVGNVELTPKRLSVRGNSSNTAPHLRLSTPDAIGSTRTKFRIDVQTLDLENDAVTLTLDLDANGSFETTVKNPSNTTPYSTTLLAAGRRLIKAEARDAAGKSRTAQLELFVLSGNAPPQIKLNAPGSQQNGTAIINPTFTVQSTSDADSDSVQYNWFVEVSSLAKPWRVQETGFGSNKQFSPQLAPPQKMNTTALGFAASTLKIQKDDIWDVAVIRQNIVALALNQRGVAFFNITNRATPTLITRLALETTARRLYLHGNKLYVLGHQLAVIDVSNITAPIERKQAATTTNTRISDNNYDSKPILLSGEAAEHQHVFWIDELISTAQVTVNVSHPNASLLTVTLVPPKNFGLPGLVLMDRLASANGKTTFTFSSATNANLRKLIGKFTGGQWAISVKEAIPRSTGKEGSLVSSNLQFVTKHRAVNVLTEPRQIVGVVDSGPLVIAGQGLQALNVSTPTAIKTTSTLTGWLVQNAQVNGASVMGGSVMNTDAQVDVSGLFAVDFTAPAAPKVQRTVNNVNVFNIAVVGTRFYAEVAPVDGSSPTFNLIGNLGAFKTGQSFELARPGYSIYPGAFGDDATLWTIDRVNHLVKLDVSDPKNLKVLDRIEGPLFQKLVPNGTTEFVGMSLTEQPFVGSLTNRSSMNTTSRFYDVTLEAKDASGAITRAVRHVHLVPYAHIPTLQRVERVYGNKVGEEWAFDVYFSDPDGAPTWDPIMMARADLDGDGVLESRWATQEASGGTVRLLARFSEPGERNLNFQARDGFYGMTQPMPLRVTVQAATPCGGTYGAVCAQNEFCKRDGADECNEAAVGACWQKGQMCNYGDPTAPVCGCNYRTYYGECEAWSDGMNVRYSGECQPLPCSSNTDCPSFMFCDFPINEKNPALSCGASGGGVCMETPPYCPFGMPDPVCGCDGQSYTNTCFAHRARVSVRKAGDCL